MTRVTSALVLVALLGTVAVRLGCAWTCQPSLVTTAAEHCHEPIAAGAAFSTPAPCNDLQSDRSAVATTTRSDVAVIAAERVSVLAWSDEAFRMPLVDTNHRQASPPPSFVIPLRQ